MAHHITDSKLISYPFILIILLFIPSQVINAQAPASVDSVPTISTLSVTNITQYSATSGGNITSDGGDIIGSRGICWNMVGNPTTSDTKVLNGRGTGSFTCNLTGLSMETKYYVRAYATNGFGTAYGNEVSFETKDTVGLTPAFPGAEGYGKYTTGGRGGRVLEVNNLNDSGPGSLRDAIDQKFPRIIVFQVSGTIFLQSTLSIKDGDITIAGQTAPGDGICLAGFTLTVDADNVIIRFIRSRHGDLTPSQDDAMNGRNHKNIIIDHCSMTWSVDECASFYDNEYFTMQWCIVGESLYNSIHDKGNHGYGGIEGGWGATFHHNLYVSNTSRNPRFCGARYHLDTPEKEIVDFVNNVIYNWGFNSIYGGELGQQNVRSNYFKSGPATDDSKKNRILNPSISSNPPAGYGKFYVADNYVVGFPNTTSDNWSDGVQGVSQSIKDDVKVDQPFPIADVTIQMPEEAYQMVLDNAGATLPKRDSVDSRLISDTRNGTATYEGPTYKPGTIITGIIDSQTDVGGWPILHSSPAPPDSDHDGMPDEWEVANNLNPYDSSDARAAAPDGYTMVEKYINSLAANITTSIKDSRQIPTSFSLKQNYPNPFNPTTKIEFSIPVKASIKLEVFDLLGRKILKLLDQEEDAGNYTINFDGSSLSSGIYIYSLSSPYEIMSKKMILLK
jgi:pectate lyase